MRKLRIYADTSVLGGCFDEEFAEHSQRLVSMARDGEIVLVISAVVLRELAGAPPFVRQVLVDLPQEAIEIAEIDDDVARLAAAYIDGGVVGSGSLDDAVHVAIATVSGCDAIVSWNFRHIVRLDRIQQYNKVNQCAGYRDLVIVTPMEVRRDADEAKDI